MPRELFEILEAFLAAITMAPMAVDLGVEVALFELEVGLGTNLGEGVGVGDLLAVRGGSHWSGPGDGPRFSRVLFVGKSYNIAPWGLFPLPFCRLWCFLHGYNKRLP